MILPSEHAGGAESATPKFPLGQLVATPAVLDALTHEDIQTALKRHLSGDWGDVCEEDRAENDLSLERGFRLLSVYQGKNGTKFWIITEADRSVTTVLLPSNY
jgi:hypothetical protein